MQQADVSIEKEDGPWPCQLAAPGITDLTVERDAVLKEQYRCGEVLGDQR